MNWFDWELHPGVQFVLAAGIAYGVLWALGKARIFAHLVWHERELAQIQEQLDKLASEYSYELKCPRCGFYRKVESKGFDPELDYRDWREEL